MPTGTNNTGDTLTKIVEKPLERLSKELSQFDVITWENVEQKSLFLLRLLDAAHDKADILTIILKLSDEEKSSSQTEKAVVLDAMIRKINLIEKGDDSVWGQLVRLIVKNHSKSRAAEEKSHAEKYVEKILLMIMQEKLADHLNLFDYLFKEGYRKQMYAGLESLNLDKSRIDEIASLYGFLKKNEPGDGYENKNLREQNDGILAKMMSVFYEKAAEALTIQNFSEKSIQDYLEMISAMWINYVKSNKEPIYNAYYATVFSSARTWAERKKILYDLKIKKTPGFIEQEIQYAMNLKEIDKDIISQIQSAPDITPEEKVRITYLLRTKQKELFENAIIGAENHSTLNAIEETIPNDFFFLKERVLEKAAELLKK